MGNMQVERDQDPPCRAEVTSTKAIRYKLRLFIRKTACHLRLHKYRGEGLDREHQKPRAINTSDRGGRPVIQVQVVQCQQYSIFDICLQETMPPASPFCPFAAVQRSIAMCNSETMELDKEKLGRPEEALTSHPLRLEMEAIQVQEHVTSG